MITMADNASTDRTWEIAEDLAIELVGVRAVHLEQKGRGRALQQVWSGSEATICAYMDVDLSTDLNALLPLVAPLISGHSDLAIGTRLSRSSRVVRGAKRELISRSYNLLLRGALSVSFSDAQCGFKAIRTEAARRFAPPGRGHRLVLRHRAARPRPAMRATHSRGARGLGRRSRQPRRHRRHREGRRPGDRAAAARLPPPAGSPSPTSVQSSGARRHRAARWPPPSLGSRRGCSASCCGSARSGS